MVPRRDLPFRRIRCKRLTLTGVPVDEAERPRSIVTSDQPPPDLVGVRAQLDPALDFLYRHCQEQTLERELRTIDTHLDVAEDEWNMDKLITAKEQLRRLVDLAGPARLQRLREAAAAARTSLE